MLLRKRWSNVLSFLLLVIFYFTRPQAFIFIAGYILLDLLLTFKAKKALAIFIGILVIGLFIDRLVLIPLGGKYHLYSITGRGIPAVTQHSQYVAVSDVLRGVEKQPASIILTIKKTGTNLFNFYRSLPQIVNPYIFTFFVLSPLVLFKKRQERAFLTTTFFTAFLSFLVPALTIPFYWYIHPVLPLLYIVGIASLVGVIDKVINDWSLVTGKDKKFLITDHKSLVTLTSFILVSIFVLIMQIGTYIHDYKYYEVRKNYSNPPVYLVLSRKLKEITKPNDFVVTNIDTWGSWYGERKPVWFPLEPDQLILPEGNVNPFDAIYLTSYLVDNENYFMGSAWREIFENPENIENEFIRENFEFAGEFKIPADEVHEKYDSRAVLL